MAELSFKAAFTLRRGERANPNRGPGGRERKRPGEHAAGKPASRLASPSFGTSCSMDCSRGADGYPRLAGEGQRRNKKQEVGEVEEQAPPDHEVS